MLGWEIQLSRSRICEGFQERGCLMNGLTTKQWRIQKRSWWDNRVTFHLCGNPEKNHLRWKVFFFVLLAKAKRNTIIPAIFIQSPCVWVIQWSRDITLPIHHTTYTNTNGTGALGPREARWRLLMAAVVCFFLRPSLLSPPCPVMSRTRTLVNVYGHRSD